MGSNVVIGCRSDTETVKMEWLRNGNEVVAFMSMKKKLDLPFNFVSDCVHGMIYTCRVTRNGGEVAEQDFTMNVTSKEEQLLIINE